MALAPPAGVNTREADQVRGDWPPALGDTILLETPAFAKTPTLALAPPFPGARRLWCTDSPPCPACSVAMAYSADDIEWRCAQCGAAPSRQALRRIAYDACIWRLNQGYPRWWRLAYAAYLRWRWLRRPD